ncbi:MAG: PIG-L family deacetylase [Albidovulum sp.]|nr:PIG-L family deacetylase [Albidovulum sp.]MDE0531882.1 PIG-L family deacetylase [Albidovulum sp.]
MATVDQVRIADDRAKPRVMELWWALRPLRSVVRFMNTGAHPDDETTSMLAALRIREGFSISIACSTRGEGGQNEIGTEAGGDLGALRTAEMERACELLGMRLYWLSDSPDDSIVDFGFSKSGVETLSRWGKSRTLSRLVEIVRMERPDIICPTFLDVPGQHGHHRAMTEIASLVMSAAADPDFPVNAAPWQPRKLFLPAWSGAGKSYDDNEPPPPATLILPAADGDPVSGWSWERIGQQSRAFHRSQGMGRWIPAGKERDWPLNLVESHVEVRDRSISSGLPVTVADLGKLAGAEPVAPILRSAGRELEAAIAAYPDFASVERFAVRALELVRKARKSCPAELQEDILHRLDEKEVQLGHVIRIALGVELRGRSSRTWLYPGESTDVELEVYPGKAEGVDVDFDLHDDCRAEAGALHVDHSASPTDPYRARFDPAAPAVPALAAKIRSDGVDFCCRLPLDNAPVILPGRSAILEPAAAVVNRVGKPPEIEIALTEQRPSPATPILEVPDGWTSRRTEKGFAIAFPDGLEDGLYTIPLLLDGRPAMIVRRISHSHIAPTFGYRPAEVRIRVLAAEVPKARVGYIGGGNDRVGHWLAELGADVSLVADSDLKGDALLNVYDSLVVGIFAMKFRPGLLDAVPRLHRWVKAGGTLVTLYHRPWDNWDPEIVPPRRLEIGQPSLRWRVTNPAAEVKHICPDHATLNFPNPIGLEDWKGWHKERGMYFAKSWDEAYRPLVEMADNGEEPHRGAMLSADIGRGRHAHISLTLHHQMENLVPGAFRLMANLISRRT